VTQARQPRLQLLGLTRTRRGSVYLVQLETQVVGLAIAIRKRSLRSTQGIPRFGHIPPGRRVPVPHAHRRVADEPVQIARMTGRGQQRLMLMLTVQIDVRADDLREHRHRRQLTVNRALRAALGTQAPPYEDLPAVEHEAALHERFLGTLPHQRGIGPFAQQQLECGDEHRLARPRLSGEHGEARPELEPHLLDECEVLHMELGQHVSVRGTSSTAWCRSPARRAS